MSNQRELAAAERAVTGKQVKRLRQQGIVPAVISGHNQPSVSLQVSALELQNQRAQDAARRIGDPGQIPR